jgi:hypothetical protein
MFVGFPVVTILCVSVSRLATYCCFTFRMSHGRLVAGACCLAALLSGKEGSKEGSWTNCETPEREEQAIKLDGLSVAEIKEMQDSAEKHVFLFQVRFLPHRSGHVTISSRLTLLNSLPEKGGLP